LNSRLALAKQLLHMSLSLSPFFFSFWLFFIFAYCQPQTKILTVSTSQVAGNYRHEPPCLTHHAWPTATI
jgi:hypothetical protein